MLLYKMILVADWPEKLISYNRNYKIVQGESVADWPEKLISYNKIKVIKS